MAIETPPAYGTLTGTLPSLTYAPADGAVIDDNTPDFTWETLFWATLYRLQIDLDPAFGGPVIDTAVNGPPYTPPVIEPTVEPTPEPIIEPVQPLVPIVIPTVQPLAPADDP